MIIIILFVQREDETEEAISHRLATYNEKTAPFLRERRTVAYCCGNLQ
jgi:adenylate kinase family enzyme